MKVSVVLIWLCLSFVQLRRLDDQHALANSVQPDVWTELKELKVQLQSSQSQIEELKEQNAALEERVASAERGVDTLKDDSTWRPKVAFTFASGLYGYLGPLNGNAILAFRNEITNVGHAYNPISGVFTAPLRGVYNFHFKVLGISRSYATHVYLYKNHQRITGAYKHPTGYYEYATAGANLLLDRGDVVYVQLWAYSQIYDWGENHSIFSGFLVFSF